MPALSMIWRRRLELPSYDDLLVEVGRLRDRGYARAGNWALPEMLAHLARTMEAASDPATPALPWPMRWAAQAYVLPRFLAGRAIARRLPMPRVLRVPVVPTQATADALFAAAVARVRRVSAARLAHPLFGPLSLADFHCVQLAHASHHLGFLIPRG